MKLFILKTCRKYERSRRSIRCGCWSLRRITTKSINKMECFIIDVDGDIPKELLMCKHEHSMIESFRIVVFQYRDQLPIYKSKDNQSYEVVIYLCEGIKSKSTCNNFTGMPSFSFPSNNAHFFGISTSCSFKLEAVCSIPTEYQQQPQCHFDTTLREL